ncbi:S41 family peptidase [Alistipes sp. An116]|uniref:S41 family peptidase n=1 Tax=Alistipes sp. An116 TaxID=1965546 RepID=UPI0013A66AAB|nr:S41 family peptidase [Alistipes sp. An116]
MTDIYPFTLLTNYHYAIVTAFDYKIQLVRNGNMMEMNTPGLPWKEVYLKLNQQSEFQSRIFHEAQTGYFRIGEFYPNNNLMIRKLRTAIQQARREGCISFILDLRGNLGGNGHAFDRLLSIFINKPAIPYLRGKRLKVSPWSLQDYDFLTADMLGSVIEVPCQYTNKTVSLNQQLYIPGMQFYVLMDKDTSSIAASSCNIMQYNGAALLVEEPLRHNALKYGETVGARYGISGLYLTVSTVEFDEYSDAVDGVLIPDIAIPYVARDYLSGQDAMLNKLLEIIREQNEQSFK